MDNEKSIRLLQFVTGTCRLPVGGFAELIGRFSLVLLVPLGRGEDSFRGRMDLVSSWKQVSGRGKSCGLCLLGLSHVWQAPGDFDVGRDGSVMYGVFFFE